MQKTIYLVEDDEGIRELLVIILGKQYHIQSFENLRTFRTQMELALPDLIIMDIMLPDGNGDDAGMALQKDDATKDIPILFMSANMRFELKAPLATHCFIGKPFNIKAFEQKIKHLLHLQQQ